MKTVAALLMAIVAAIALTSPAWAFGSHRLPPPCSTSFSTTVERQTVSATSYRLRTVTTRTVDCPGPRHDSRTVSTGPWGPVYGSR